MDFTKIYYPQPVTFGDFKVQQPETAPEATLRNEYHKYLEEFQTNLQKRINNGERFYSAAEIAEKLVALQGDDDEEECEDAVTAGFRVRSITEIPREQIRAFITDLTIEQVFKQV